MKTPSKSGAVDAALFIATFLIFGGLYRLAQYLFTAGTSAATFLDALVPYVSYFVIPYVLYFPYILLPFLVTWKNPANFRKCCYALMLISVIAFAIFGLYQTTAPRAEIQGGGFFDGIVLSIYAGDPNLNSFPSIHVTTAMLALLILHRLRKNWDKFSIPLAVLIMLSTVFIKQHNVVDILGGLALGWFGYYIAFKRSLFSPASRSSKAA